MFHDSSRRFGIIVLVVLAFLVAAGFAARPLWKLRKQTLAERFADQALEARGRNDWKAAEAALRAAHDLAPTHPDVLRGLAEFYSQFNNPGAVAYWEMLEGSGTMNRKDRLGYTRLALRLHRVDLAKRVLRPFHEQHPGDPAGLALISEIFEQEGDLVQALAAARDAVSRGGHAASAELRLAGLELGSAVRGDRSKGKARLLSLLAAGPEHRGQAAFLLLSRGNPTRAEESLMAKLIPAGPTNSFPDRLAHLALALRRTPAAYRELAGEFRTANQLGKASPELVTAAEQLSSVGAFGAVAELVPEELALRQPALCRLRLAALAALGAGVEFERLLASPDAPLSPVQHAVFRAVAAQVAHRTNDAVRLWASALAASSKSPAALEFLAQRAEQTGATGAAIEAWGTMLQDPVLARRAAENMLRLGMAARDPQVLRQALRRVTQLQPDASEARLALAFCDLLLGLEDGTAKAALAAGAGAYPRPAFYHVTAALAALRQGQVEQAAATIADPVIDWGNAPVAWRVVRTAVLGRSGQNTHAREVAATLDRAQLSAAELALVENWLPLDPK